MAGRYQVEKVRHKWLQTAKIKAWGNTLHDSTRRLKALDGLPVLCHFLPDGLFVVSMALPVS